MHNVVYSIPLDSTLNPIRNAYDLHSVAMYLHADKSFAIYTHLAYIDMAHRGYVVTG